MRLRMLLVLPALLLASLVPALTAGPADAASQRTWDRLAACESGGRWHIATGNGFYGGLQFTLGSWQAAGGSGYPHEASTAEQIHRGEILQGMQGWGAWPVCAAFMR